MTLREYLIEAGMTAEQFGKQINKSRFTVGKWVRLERIPRRAEMALIQSATNGKVTADDFYRASSPDKNTTCAANARRR